MSYCKIPIFHRPFNTMAATLLILCCCAVPGTSADSPPLPPVSPPLTLEELKNATYAGIDTTPIKLTRGLYEGSPYLPGGASRQRIELLESQPVTGDLSGDGNNDSLVFLSEDDGGSGAFLYMAVMGRIQGKIVNIATVRLGDRISVRSISVDKGQITLDLLLFGPKDLPCCPSDLVQRVWTLERAALVERVGKKRQGSLKPATLEGVEWLFRGVIPQLTEPDGAGGTLILEKERISGSAGCNRFLGNATAAKVPGDINFKATKITNRVCGGTVMAHEEEYLEALRHVVKFGYFLGDLTLSWRKKDGTLGIIRFAPRKTS